MRLFLALALCVLGAATPTLSALVNVAYAQAPLTGNIRQIIVEGNERIETRTIESYILLEPGDPFDATRIDLSFKTLFATGLFADVLLEQRGQDLIVRVVENPIINRVLFEGNNAIDEEKMLEEIQAAPRGVFTAARVRQDVQRILELYRRSGRFAANVTPQYKPLNQNRVDVIFEISEGPVTGVRAINFIGNTVFSDRRLRSEIVTRQSRLWRFFSSNDNYDPDRLEYDRDLIRQFYANEGYADFRVVSAVAELTPDQEDFYITFTIDEGEQYTFGEIEVDTALEKLNEAALRNVVPIRSGELYKGDLIEDSVDSLTFAAGVGGYAFVDVRPRVERNPETRTVDITFALDEGPRVYIERINVVGNTRTLDRVIRREMRISEGDAFNRVLLDQSRNRVRRLGFFKNVEISESQGSLADRTVVDVTVEEQPTGEVSFAAGYSSVDNLLFDLSVAERNWRGRGQQLRAALSTSRIQQQLNLQFTEPSFLDRNLAAGFDVFATRADYLRFSDFETESVGSGLRAGFPLSDRAQLGLRYTLRQDDVNVLDRDIVIDGEGEPVFVDRNGDGFLDDYANQTDVDLGRIALPEGGAVVDQCSSAVISGQNALCDSERSDLSSIIGYSITWDRRNDPIEPTRGFRTSFSQDIAGIGGDTFYLRSEVNAALYRGIIPGFRATARLATGYVDSWNGDDLRINNRFFKGGNTFRGFDVAGLGPREIRETLDADGNVERLQRGSSLGGKFYGIGTLELTVPNLLPEEYGIKTSLFAEAGTVGLLDDDDKEFTQDEILDADGNVDGFFITRTPDDLSLRASTGLSVAWDSPFGPIRLDFSHILASEEFDETQSFRFSTSTQF